MRRVWWAILLALSAPAWALAAVLVPVYLVERASMACCRGALFGFLAAMRGRPVPMSALSSRERYYAKARNARRAHKAVRP